MNITLSNFITIASLFVSIFAWYQSKLQNKLTLRKDYLINYDMVIKSFRIWNNYIFSKGYGNVTRDFESFAKKIQLAKSRASVLLSKKINNHLKPLTDLVNKVNKLQVKIMVKEGILKDSIDNDLIENFKQDVEKLTLEQKNHIDEIGLFITKHTKTTEQIYSKFTKITHLTHP